MLTWKSRDTSARKNPPKSIIKETADFRSLLNECKYNTFVILDLDQTVFKSSQELGGDPWFSLLCAHALKAIADKSEAIHYAVKLYHLVQHHTKMKQIEDNTALIIKLLQDIHIPVIALTSRGGPIIDSTLQQLKDVGIDFSRNWESLSFPHPIILAEENKQGDPIELEHGIIFCNGRDKDQGLEAFFTFLKKYGKEFPENVVMAEDRRKHLEAVARVVAAHGADFTGLRYNRLDQESATIDMDKAADQLEQLSREQFSESERELLTKLKFPVKRKTPDASPTDNSQPPAKRQASAEAVSTLRGHSIFTSAQPADDKTQPMQATSMTL